MQALLRNALLVVFSVWLCLAGATAWAETGILVVHAKDVKRRPVAGLEVGVEGDGGSAVTDRAGKARIKLAPQTKEKSSVPLQIVKSPSGQDLVMVSPWDYRTQVPSFENESDNFVEVVVVQRGDRAALEDGTVLKAAASQINKANAPKTADQHDSQADRKANLDAVAKQFGLSPEDLDKAIRAWGGITTDPYEAGLAALYARNYDKASVDLQASLKQREENLASDQKKLASDQSGVADAAFFLGQSLQQQGKYKESEVAYERCLALVRLANNRQGEGITLVRLGQLNALQEKPETFEKAIGYFTAALPLFQAISDRFNETYSWWGLAGAYDRLGRTQQARDAYLKTLPFFTAKKDDRALGLVLLDVGEDEDELGNTQKAIEYYEQALPLLKSQGDGLRQGLTLVHLGKARQKLGDSAGAIETFKAAIPAWRSAGDQAMEATTDLMLGQAMAAANDRKGALEACGEALKLSEATGNGIGQVGALVVMTSVYSSQGDHKKALELEQKAMEILRPLDAPAATNKVLNDMGQTYSALGDYAAAEPVMRQALATCEKTYGPDHPELAYSLNNLATLLENKGDYAAAEPLFQRALAIDAKALGPEHPNTQAIRKNLEEAQQKSGQGKAAKGKN
jgi:tetratricopeptide (TPR) repeat protein